MTASHPSKPSLLRHIAFPRHYLWFGILDGSPPVPTGSRPSESMPYQWSCHIETASGRVDQLGFLDTAGRDPRPRLVETLLAVIDPNGAILVPSARETALLHGLQQRLADRSGALAHILARVVEVDRLASRSKDQDERRTVSGSSPAALVLWPNDPVDPSPELRDDRAAEVAYLELIDARTQNIRRRQLARALVRYGDHRIFDLVQDVAGHTGAMTNTERTEGDPVALIRN